MAQNDFHMECVMENRTGVFCNRLAISLVLAYRNVKKRLFSTMHRQKSSFKKRGD